MVSSKNINIYIKNLILWFLEDWDVVILASHGKNAVVWQQKSKDMF